MPLDGPPPGMRPDGTPFPVPAQVLPGPGRGALWGLAAGDALGRLPGEGGPAEAALEVAEHLMARGHYHLGARPGGGLARAVPIAMFWANDPVVRLDVTREAFGDEGALAAAAVSGAISAAVWRHDAAPIDLISAALASVDDLSLRIVAADPASRPAVRAASEALRLDIGDALGDRLGQARGSLAVHAALWHLFHETDVAAAIRATLAHPGAGSGEAAVVGAVLGAAVGEQGLPAALKEAARRLGPVVDRLLAFVET